MTTGAESSSLTRRLLKERMWRGYGIHALALGSLAGQAILWAFISWQLHRSGMVPTIEPQRWWFVAGLLGAWILGIVTSQNRISDRALATLIVATFSFPGLFGQYAALSLNRPWADPTLAALDRALGIHMPDVVAWTMQHPGLQLNLVVAYGSFLHQVFLCPFLFACVSSRERLWTFVVSYQIAWTVALLCVAIWPSQCAFVYLGYRQDPHLIGADLLMRDLVGARMHTLGTIALGDTNGLITFPSFHTMIGVLMIWTAVERQWLGVWFIPLNVGLIAGTLLLGPHYAVDVFASLLVMPAIIWAAHTLTRRVLSPTRVAHFDATLPAMPMTTSGGRRLSSG